MTVPVRVSALTPRIPVTVMAVCCGDTLEVIFDGEHRLVKLAGVLTPPEKYAEMTKGDLALFGGDVKKTLAVGREAAAFLNSLVKRGDIVHLEYDSHRRKEEGEIPAYVWLHDGRMLNEVMVTEGFGTVDTSDPDGAYQERLIGARRLAIDARKGIWR